MNIQSIIGWIQGGELLIAAGAATIENIKSMMASRNPTMSEEELNAICMLISSVARQRKALADLDIAGR